MDRFAAVLVAGTAACSLTTSLDGLSEPTMPGVIHGANDGSVAGDGGTRGGTDGDVGDTAAPTSFVSNGGFEVAGSSGAPCGEPWSPYRAQVAKDPMARTGAYACRVCGQGAATYTIDYGYQQSPRVTAGQTVHVRAWVRKVPASATSPTLTMTIGVYDSSGAEIDPGSDSAPGTLSDAWTARDFESKIKTTGILNVYVTDIKPGAGGCFLIDDVAAWFVP